MTESKAAESYEAFESLRNRFGGAKKPDGVDTHPHQGKAVKQKRRFDPRANAPPLVPLLEEGDQEQETVYRESTSTQRSEPGISSPVKGKWKQSTFIKSNHLNSPDFDALETASTASSSAYSSKSESLSPTVGSVTELSDTGSTDSFLEYDLGVKKQSGTSTVKFTLERPRSANAQIRFGGQLQTDADVPDDYVHGCTKAWNKVIGRWVFEGIPQTYSPSMTRTRRPSNEIRIPTPLGSLENLAASGSRSSLLGGGSCTSLQDEGSCTSLLSSNFDDSEDDSTWNQKGRYKLGKFCHDRRKSPVIAHTSYRMNSSSSCSELDSRLALLDERRDAVTGTENTDTMTHPAQTQLAQIDVAKDGSQISASNSKTDESEEHVTLGRYKLGKFYSAQNSSHSSTSSNTRDVNAPGVAPPTKTKPLNRSRSETRVQSSDMKTEQKKEGGSRYRHLPSAKIWLEAHRKYSSLRQHSRSPEKDGINADANKQSSEEPVFSSGVEQRAKLFGGTKRSGLRRTKSLHIGAHKRRQQDQ